MCARQYLVTILSNHILALLSQTNVIEGTSFLVFLLVDEDFVAEPTLSQQVWMFKKSSLGDLSQHQAGSGLAANNIALSAKQIA